MYAHYSGARSSDKWQMYRIGKIPMWACDSRREWINGLNFMYISHQSDLRSQLSKSCYSSYCRNTRPLGCSLSSLSQRDKSRIPPPVLHTCESSRWFEAPVLAVRHGDEQGTVDTAPVVKDLITNPVPLESTPPSQQPLFFFFFSPSTGA